MKIYHSQDGFTLMELLIAVVIMITITGVGLASYSRQTEEKVLENEVNKLVDTLSLARAKAVAGDTSNPTNPLATCTTFNGYRVRVNLTSYTLALRCDGADQVLSSYTLPGGLTVVSTPAPPYYIYFLSSRGGLVGGAARSFQVRNVKSRQCITIDINNLGIIQQSARISC